MGYQEELEKDRKKVEKKLAIEMKTADADNITTSALDLVSSLQLSMAQKATMVGFLILLREDAVASRQREQEAKACLEEKYKKGTEDHKDAYLKRIQEFEQIVKHQSKQSQEEREIYLRDLRDRDQILLETKRKTDQQHKEMVERLREAEREGKKAWAAFNRKKEEQAALIKRLEFSEEHRKRAEETCSLHTERVQEMQAAHQSTLEASHLLLDLLWFFLCDYNGVERRNLATLLRQYDYDSNIFFALSPMDRLLLSTELGFLPKQWDVFNGDLDLLAETIDRTSERVQQKLREAHARYDRIKFEMDRGAVLEHPAERQEPVAEGSTEPQEVPQPSEEPSPPESEVQVVQNPTEPQEAPEKEVPDNVVPFERMFRENLNRALTQSPSEEEVIRDLETKARLESSEDYSEPCGPPEPVRSA